MFSVIIKRVFIATTAKQAFNHLVDDTLTLNMRSNAPLLSSNNTNVSSPLHIMQPTCAVALAWEVVGRQR